MALKFDGTDDRVEVGTWGISGDQLTIMGWAKWTAANPPTDPRIFSKGPDIYYQNFAILLNGGNKKFVFRIYNPSSGILTAPSVSSSNTWYHVCGTYDGSTMRLYIDGVEVASMSKSGNLTNDTAPVWIGGQPSTATSRPWEGSIADVRAYSRALSANEILTIFNSNGLDGIVHGLEGRWALNYGDSGTTVSTTANAMKDSSEKKRDGTAQSSSAYDDGIIRMRRRPL